MSSDHAAGFFRLFKVGEPVLARILEKYNRHSPLTAILIGLTVLGLTRAKPVLATVLPESYGMMVPEKGRPVVDPELEKWLRDHMEVQPLAEAGTKRVESLQKQGDRVAAAYAKQYLNRERNVRDDKLNAENLALARFEIEEFNKNAGSVSAFPLLPYLLSELTENPAISDDQKSLLNTALRRMAPESCPVKRSVIRSMTRQNIKDLSSDELLASINLIQSFYSSRFKKQAFEAFLTALPAEKRPEVQEKLIVAVRTVDGIARKFPWIDPEKNQFSTGGGGDVYSNIRRLAGKRQCKPAENEFKTILSEDAPATSLTAAIAAGTAIDRCLRSKSGLSSSIAFWRGVLPAFQKKFLFRGQSSVEQRIAILEWTSENNAEAKKQLTKIMSEAAVEKDLYAEAKALYTLARIEEDEKNYASASSLYGTYTDRFRDQDNFESAFMSVVTLLAMENRWPEMLKPLTAIISDQSELPQDERSTGALSFALFWAGRTHFEMGKPELAIEMWKRAAAEYYSTFYGALSHFLIERDLSETFALEPSRTPPFRAETLRLAFSGKQRAIFDRASALLRMGRKPEASCEISELDVSEFSPEKVLAKAMLLHAAGDWLDAIKLFDGLPRSFRNSLPSGVERILFPLGYSAEIVEHSSRLGIDPDLMFALIRQESVYNPRAQSLVGALGLMQLMPATARLEAGRLSSGYLTPVRRKELSRAVGSAKGILAAENNIALGVHHFHRLLNKYKSPVFALAAYNASPKAVEKWLKTMPNDDLLVFMERIPYAETRAYVKLILRNYFYYKRWYPDVAGRSPKTEVASVRGRYRYLQDLTTRFGGKNKPHIDRGEIGQTEVTAADEESEVQEDESGGDEGDADSASEANSPLGEALTPVSAGAAPSGQ